MKEKENQKKAKKQKDTKKQEKTENTKDTKKQKKTENTKDTKKQKENQKEIDWSKPLPSFKKGGGLLLGQSKQGKKQTLYYVSEDTHTLCIGATRSGKSRCIVLPTIGLQALAGENIVCSDPKGELYQYTYPFLERLDYEVITLDFKNPLKSSRYNFLQNVIDAMNEGDMARASSEAWDMTQALVGDSKNSEPIWSNGEKAVIGACILAVVYDNQNNPEYQNLTNVYYFLANMCKPVKKDIPMNQYMNQLQDDHPAKALMGIAEVAPEKTRSSFFTSALATLRLFTSPDIYHMTSASDFDIRDTEKKRAIFIILPDEKATYYSLASLFVNQFYAILVANADNRGGRLERRINFNLDEFGNFTRIPDFDKKLTVGGGRGIRFNLFLQALSQLEESYNRELSKTIQSNCSTWLYLQADDMETLETVSKKLGNYTVMAGSQSNSSGQSSSSSASYSLMSRPLLTVDEVKMISRPYTLITSREHPVMMKAPDIAQTFFNDLFGLGDVEHNRKLREERENRREVRTANELQLWRIWEEFGEKKQKQEQMMKQYKENMQ